MELETCSISSTDIERFRSYGVPDDAKVVKPSSNQTVFDTPEGMVAVYMEFFDKCGLRFPLTTFFCRCLIYYELSITQLAPDFVRCMVGFEVLCKMAKVEPTVALFTYFFYPSKSRTNWCGIRMRTPNPTKWIFDYPESSGWKAKFVFIGKEMFPEEMSTNRNTSNRYPKPYLRLNMLDKMRILSGYSVEWSVLLSEEMLHSAKMPNVYTGPLPVKLRAKNGNEISSVDFLCGMSTGGKDGKSRKTRGGSATPSKRAKLVDIMMRDDGHDNGDGESIDNTGEKDGKSRNTLGGGATQSKRAKLSAVMVRDDDHDNGDDVQIKNKRIAAVEAALEEVRCMFMDSEKELVVARDVARKYRQELSAEVEKNRVLQEALELETSHKEDKNLAEDYRQALKKNMLLEEDLDKATRQLETASKKALEKISALEEAKKEASNYEQGLDAEMKKNVVLKEALEKARSELDAEKARSAIAREEADKAKKDAEDLHSRIYDAIKIRT